MPHFFVSPQRIIDGVFVLDPEESAHLARVLRKQVGDEIRLFDGVDRSYRGVLTGVTPGKVEGKILGEASAVLPPYFLRLYQAVPKGDTFEWIVEKATELGVSEIVALHAQRNVGRVPADRVAAKRARWEKVARAASAQCGRADTPLLSGPLDFDAVLARVGPSETWIIPWEGESQKSLKSILSAVDRAGRPPVVNVMIGPEGGFDPGEVGRACDRGVIPVTLGPRILRTETAGVFVVSSLLYELGL
ncbi:MAG: 16S rRNA (uracil(1498)-N(3))-methyltransferase [Elusimicrobia bacterium]|nr:16S rRNA (uracil(1498)-N(3))-methyltransferase [Elusimicrobiota bacterium]